MNFLYIDHRFNPVPVTKRQIKARFPNVSFPSSYPKERMAEFGIFVWQADPQPAFDPETQRLVPGEWRIEGDEYRREWVVEDIPQAEIDAAKDAEALSAADQLAFKLIFLINNEVRVLKGQEPVTRQQFIQFVRSQID